MATFSGFKSKANETYYDQLVFKTIQLLSYKVLHLTKLSEMIVNNQDVS